MRVKKYNLNKQNEKKKKKFYEKKSQKTIFEKCRNVIFKMKGVKVIV